MELIRATQEHLRTVCDLYRRVADKMVSDGLDQWLWGRYPNEDVLHDSITRGETYLALEFGKVVACVAIQTEMEEEFNVVNWKFGTRPGLFHRLAVDPRHQHHGIGGRVLDQVELLLRAQGCDCLRCDTRADNQHALHLYATHAMQVAGPITSWDNDPEGHYIALEKPLIRECVMLPVRMHPAFRSGKLTPWGGEKLRTVYGKAIPEIPTGESLEVSCIPGLESTDDAGNKLTDMLALYGERFSGRFALEPFPLLLKLIDASESLSVQVHPDDTYAAAHENGKLGKTEAWLILDAPEGSELVYGIVPGTDIAALRTASEAGSAVSPLLRRVKVQPGDVCYIPAGCVHAIGPGITLYEIQQSSDITYRFYDWDRTDSQGKKRELHIDKALSVTDLSFAPDPIHTEAELSERVLSKKYFTLDLIGVHHETALPAVTDFGLLTVLDGELKLCWNDENMLLHKGESVFIPASCPALTLQGIGRAALSMPVFQN